MNEIKRIKKYIMDEYGTILDELDHYTNLFDDINEKIEHSNRFVLSLLADDSSVQTVFSPYSKNSDKQFDIEDEKNNIERLTQQKEVVKKNISVLESKKKKLFNFLEELEQFSDKEFYFLDSKEYNFIQDLLEEYEEQTTKLTDEFEKKLNQFVFIDPNRTKIEFFDYRKKMDSLLEKIDHCKKILSDNRIKNN